MNTKIWRYMVLFFYLKASVYAAPANHTYMESEDLKVDDDGDIDIFEQILKVNKDIDATKLFEGDIVLEDDHSILRAALRNQSRLWPNGIVYYTVSKFMLYPESLRKAMDDIEAASCIRFKNFTGIESHHLYIKSAFGCWSKIGRSDNFQELSLGPGCHEVGTAQHELMHALGFHHEQSRPDRDSYVTIFLENVMNGAEFNFEKGNITDFHSFTPYDYESIMHYPKTAFSINGRATIIPKPNPNTPIGKSISMSDRDKEDIRRLYNCHTVESIHGSWGSWTNYSSCIPSCLDGTKTRIRLCNNPKPWNGGRVCIGRDSQSLLCSKGDCTGAEYGTCNFEKNMCAWTSFYNFLMRKNTMKFQRNSGRTPSIFTGPDDDHTLKNGLGTYVYLEVTSSSTSHYGLLRGPVLPAIHRVTPKRCLSFWYHMYGRDMGYMMVYIQDIILGYHELIWHAGGNKGSLWQFKNITIDSTSEKKIIFYGMRGTGYTGDMALDDIKVEENACH